MREIESLVDQMGAEDRRRYLVESLFLNYNTYEGEMLDAYARKLTAAKKKPLRGARGASDETGTRRPRGCRFPRRRRARGARRGGPAPAGRARGLRLRADAARPHAAQGVHAEEPRRPRPRHRGRLHDARLHRGRRRGEDVEARPLDATRGDAADARRARAHREEDPSCVRTTRRRPSSRSPSRRRWSRSRRRSRSGTGKGRAPARARGPARLRPRPGSARARRPPVPGRGRPPARAPRRRASPRASARRRRAERGPPLCLEVAHHRMAEQGEIADRVEHFVTRALVLEAQLVVEHARLADDHRVLETAPEREPALAQESPPR